MRGLIRAIANVPLFIILVGIASAILLPPYEEYIERSKQYVCSQDPNDPVCQARVNTNTHRPNGR